MVVYYLIPIIFIVAAVVISSIVRKRITARTAAMTPEQAAEAMHNYYAGYFVLAPTERIIGTWSGVDFLKPEGTATRAASAALNAASDALIGVSKYTPTVQIGLTSLGRVLVSREYSEGGRRGNFQQVASLDRGVVPTDGASAYPGVDLGTPPKNPFSPLVKLEFVHLQAEDGEAYDAWVTPQGSMVGAPGFVSISQALGK